ncbi:phage upper tail fiber protein [Pseudooceanicola nitratireducens]|uniref:phage upper tail fiber protein n=1 Tax=Pseudooceanicola nitratireducens TaxID=517719 RepID=UPI0023F39C71|nr:putative Ig domain-containing protein [Pseudooceanicola nitratireducens]
MANQFPMGGGGSRPKLIITGNSGPGSLYEANDTLSIADDTFILESQKGDTPDWTPEGGGLTTAATFVATPAASLLVEYAGLTKTIAKSQGAITVSGLADQTVAHGAAVSINAASAFSGTVTTYSIVSGPDWLSINPAAGAITGTAPGSATTVTITVRASNNAGSATDSFSITEEAEEPDPVAGLNVVEVTQAEYDALTPDPGTIYAITTEGGGGQLTPVAISREDYAGLTPNGSSLYFLSDDMEAATTVTAISEVTRSEYDALTPDPSTLYKVS